MTNLRAAIIPVTLFQQNCTLLWDENSKKGVVIDPGGEVPRIMEAIEQIELDVEKIVLTHGHIDHAGGALDLKEKLKVGVEGPHLADEFLLDGIEEQAQEYGISDVKNIKPDIWLTEKDTLSMAGNDFKIMHCPGHSPGSLVYYNDEEKFTIVGDVLFRGSVGRTDFSYGDTEALLTSIKNNLLTLDDEVSFICGHGQGGTIGEERKTNPFLRQ